MSSFEVCRPMLNLIAFLAMSGGTPMARRIGEALNKMIKWSIISDQCKSIMHVIVLVMNYTQTAVQFFNQNVEMGISCLYTWR